MYHLTSELVKEGDLEKVKNFVNGNELDGKDILKIEIEKVICHKYSKKLQGVREGTMDRIFNF